MRGAGPEVLAGLLKAGDAAAAVGDLAAADVAFSERLRLSRQRLLRDPTDAWALRDVLVSLNRVGDAAKLRGDLPAAQAAYAERLGPPSILTRYRRSLPEGR